MIKILFYTTNRAEYSKLRPILKLLQNNKEIDLILFIGGCHLIKEYGETKYEIIKDNITINEEIYSHISGDDLTKTPEIIGLSLLKLAPLLKKYNPDIVFVGFDRFDIYPLAISASLMNFCIVHLEGGEISGTHDDKIRHSITKLSNYHLVSTEEAKNNLIKMGENENTIFITGCPRYSNLLKINKLEEDSILNKYDLKKKEFIILCYHPNSMEIQKSIDEFNIILNVLLKYNKKIIFIKPNIDYGNEKLLKLLHKIQNNNNFIIFNHIDIDDFSILLKNTSLLIGNSSAGIREGCVFGTPVINVGTRQQYRTNKQLINVYNINNFNETELINIIDFMYNKYFNSVLAFGFENSDERIIETLKKINYKNTNKKLDLF